MAVKPMLLLVILNCLAVCQVSSQDRCTSNNGQPDWSVLNGINNYNDVIQNIDSLVEAYANCGEAAATQLGVEFMNCTTDQVTEVLCGAQTMKVMIDWTIRNSQMDITFILAKCIPEPERCDYYEHSIIHAAECFSEKADNAELYTHFCGQHYEQKYNRPITMDILLYLPRYILYEYVELLNNNMLTLLLEEVIDRPYMFQLFDCESKLLFMEYAEARGVLSSKLSIIEGIVNKAKGGSALSMHEVHDLEIFFNFMPYFTYSVCNAVINTVGDYILDNSHYIADVHFGCTEEDSLVYNITAGSGASLDMFAQFENISSAAIDFMYNEVRFEDDYHCSSGCDDLMVDKAMTYLSLNTSTLDLIGGLASCLDDEDYEALVFNKPQGQCGQLPKEMMKNALVDPILAKSLADKCRPSIQDPSTLSAADIEQIGCFILCSEPEFSLHLNQTNLCTALGTNMQWSCMEEDACQDPEIGGYVLDICSSHPDIATLNSHLEAFLPFDQLKNTSLTNLPALIKKMKKAGMPQPLIDSLIDEVTTLSWDPFTVTLDDIDEDMLDGLSDDKLSQVFSNTDIDSMITSVEKMVNELPYHVAADFVSKFKTRPLNISSLRTLPEKVKSAIKMSEFSFFKACGSRPYVCLQSLCAKRNSGSWTGVKANLLSADFIAALVDAVGTEDFSAVLLAADLSKLDGACLRGFTQTHLTHFGNNARKAVMEQLAKDPRRICDVPTQNRLDFTKAAFAQIGSNLEDAATTLDDKMIGMAHLLGDLESIALKFTTKFLQNGGPKAIAAFPFMIKDQTLKNAVISALTSAMDYTNIKSWDISKLGGWLPYLYSGTTDPAQQAAIQRLVAKNIRTLQTLITDTFTVSEYNCLLQEVSDAVRAQIEGERDTLLQAMADYGIAASQVSNAGRRRRSTITSCSTIQTILPESLPSQLSLAEINAMSDAEIASCLSYLGQATGWANDQALAILNKASTNNGWTVKSSITSQNLITMGTIAYAFTTADIGQLTIDNNAIAQLGSLHQWTDAQMTAIASRYLSLQSKTPSTLTSTEIKVMMHTVCGLNTVSQVDPAQYKLSASTLASLNAATPIACLTALATLAVHANAYGATSGWTSVTYSTIGAVAIGLTGEQLNYANRDSVDALGTTIESIPAAELAKLSTTFLGYLSRTQALSITRTQRAAMSADQLAVIQSITAVTYLTTDNGASGWTVSMATLIITLMSVLWM